MDGILASSPLALINGSSNISIVKCGSISGNKASIELGTDWDFLCIPYAIGSGGGGCIFPLYTSLPESGSVMLLMSNVQTMASVGYIYATGKLETYSDTTAFMSYIVYRIS